MVVPPKHTKMIIFSRKTHSCWVPPLGNPHIIVCSQTHDFNDSMIRDTCLDGLNHLVQLRSHTVVDGSEYDEPIEIYETLPPKKMGDSEIPPTLNRFLNKKLNHIDNITSSFFQKTPRSKQKQEKKQRNPWCFFLKKNNSCAFVTTFTLILAGCQRHTCCQEVLASFKAQCQLLARDIAKLPRCFPPFHQSTAGFLGIYIPSLKLTASLHLKMGAP